MGWEIVLDAGPEELNGWTYASKISITEYTQQSGVVLIVEVGNGRLGCYDACCNH
jgi:hypothetical protein